MHRSPFAFVLAPLFAIAACSSPGSTTTGAADAAPNPALDGSTTYDGGSTLDGGPIHVGTPCAIAVDAPPLLPGTHVAVGTPVEYDSNPPSSGPHYPIWAAYKAFSTPVDRRYYVHDLEHGAIVFLYKCTASDGCPEVVATLQRASDALPDDPLCKAAGEGIRVRTVITPDPLLDVPVAAASWGWTYRADCVDLASLTNFALQHYAESPEATCSNGTDQF